MPQALRFCTLKAATAREFEPFIRIYSEALPAREQKAVPDIERMLQCASYRVLLAKRSGRVVGFAVVYLASGFALLEYIGVDRQERGAGIGARLYRLARRLAQPRPLLLEVDSELEPSADRSMRARRKGFYRRLGCRQVEGLEYRLPLPGDGPPPQMHLMVDNIDGPAVARSRVAAWLRQIYVEVYGVPDADPHLMTMVSELSDPVRLV